MEQNNKLADLAGKVTPIEEDQQGKLTGGFATFADPPTGDTLGGTNTNTNNVAGCTCSCG
jgi:hypothetical protein